MIGMIHVHSTTSILNHTYTSLLNVLPPSRSDLEELEEIVRDFDKLLGDINDSLVFQVVDRSKIRTIALLDVRSVELVNRFSELDFVRVLVERALREMEIYSRHGVKCVEVENVGAPYFIGNGACPWEDLLSVHVVTASIRKAYPNLAIGAHILSCNELEVLPIAIIHGCFFVRSEATLFRGLRPEGETTNNGNLARFMYVRNVLQTRRLRSAQFPAIWSDVMKKHTVFPSELADLETWLHNITFAKLEGVIVTGAETGSNVDEGSLQLTRKAVDKVKSWNSSQFEGNLPFLPVVTGSGLDFEMYVKYADFMIIGTAFKRGTYWENEVDEAEVEKVMRVLRD